LSDARTTEDDLPEARSIRSRWPGLVWAIPLAALIIVGYLGVHALTQQGVDVTVTFGYAEGVTPGDTKVLVNGVEAGHVSRVRVSPDAHHVDVTLSLDPREKAALNSNTKFWLIGENPTITDIQSIRAAVAGVIIAMAPGKDGEPTRHFTGLDSPPVVPPDAQGTVYFLDAPQIGSIQPGAAINYHGLAIGKVVQTGMIGLDRFRLEMFVNTPYDRYIKPGAQFWTASPIKVSLSGASISAGLSSPASVFQGAVQFELPEEARAAPQASAGTHFPLYDDQTSAQQGPTGPEIPYRLVLNGPAGDLSAGSTVSMLGYAIGKVRSTRLAFAPGGKPYTEATIGIFAHKLDATVRSNASPADWRGASDRAIGRLLAQGYRAHLVQSPPLVGAHVVTLSADRGAGPAGLGRSSPYPTIPVAEGGAGADDLIDQANQILTKINRIPLVQIGANIHTLTGNLATLSGSPQVRDSVTHLDGSLRQLDAILGQVKPQVGPLMTKLNQTADQLQGTAAAARAVLSGEGAGQDRSLPDAIQQLDEAARSIRSLTDYLGRHPEALIRGKAKEKK
jgi:paraquat-inducible protein B